MSKLQALVGKAVYIFPSDTRKKKGIILEMIDAGVLFEIIQSDCPNYVVKTQHFIAYAAGLKFATVK